MEQRTKIILGVTVGLAVVAGVGLYLYNQQLQAASTVTPATTATTPLPVNNSPVTNGVVARQKASTITQAPVTTVRAGILTAGLSQG